MIRYVVAALAVLGSLTGFSQIFNPVSWEYDSRQVAADEYDLIFMATVEDGWYVYSQFIDEGGPIPTAFIFDGDHFEILGEAEEESAHKKEGMDPVFEMHVIKYAKLVTFTQRVKITDFSKPIVGYLEYMTCDDSKCLAPTEEDFSFELKDSGRFGKTEKKEKEPEKPDEPKEDSNTEIASDSANVSDEVVNPAPTSEFEITNEPLAECGEPLVVKKTNWGIFILGFLGGLIALLTPCVFPMIPLTVSFFTKGDSAKSKGLGNAALYGFFILLVYVLLSVPFHLMDNLNPDILNEISTNVWLNVIFFIVFIVFAFSFFGYYELTLPSSWTNKASQAESTGGVIGIFFMALTLALVSFSCTGPILGSLLAGSITPQGGATQLTMGMSGFGLALGLPFALFAAFPGWIKKLPKSGGWMNNLKMALGFIELALALKFLSNADLVEHWGILKIEVFLGVWILIFVAMGVYFIRKLKLQDGFLATNLKPRAASVGVIAFLAAIYLSTGFRYNEATKSFTPLKLLSGLAPPVGYSFLYPNDCPQNLNCFKDLDEGVAYAQEQQKPIMLDFTGHACVNCRKMEEHVWPDPRVYKLLRDDYVLISLYVDDREELPEDQKVTVERATGGTRTLRTVGQKWAHFQTETFKINSQPFYALLSPSGELLNHPVAYTPDSDKYAAFLECGLSTFKSLD